MFTKVLVANRGEIACRVMRACRELGVKSVAVYSQADEGSRHVSMADEKVCIGHGTNTESYLNLANVLMAAEVTGAEAIHPGFGYFSESADFADAVRSLGLKFIGPSPESIRAMGDKALAKAAATGANVPVVGGSDGAVPNVDKALEAAAKIGYPVLLKAVAGGGGRGIRAVEDAEELKRAFEIAQAEALASFGSDALLVEKRIVRPRHIEVQVLGDEQGKLLHLYERECSVQNLRHQKIIEEAPGNRLTEEARREICEAAVRAAASVGYYNAGTVEFLYAETGDFYFLEMNTRIQVEHPVTEEVTGMDLVQWQIRIASGESLPFEQADVRLQGHAIEARITAQDPENDFAPSTGVITVWQPPGFRGVRLDTHVSSGFVVSPYYDPMIAKLIVRGEDRADAVRRLAVALEEFRIEGIATNVPFLRRLVAHPDFQAGAVHTGFVPSFLQESLVEA
ncbi:MAG: acetyl-CoA carboxylase biotin carboxylase subunit [Fimbriimonadaceae bacterium]|nr:acetyl-CoA carboxylase biotin carboxylase subunit [Fimbriimonadaceae bacterium]